MPASADEKHVVTGGVHRCSSRRTGFLAWEDIDLEAGTITIRRNYTKLGEFTLPKTDASTDRVIHLIQPAIDALRNQMEMTRLGPQYHINVQLREYGRTTQHSCTFVFNPKIVRRSKDVGVIYKVDSFGDSWDAGLKRRGSGIESLPVAPHLRVLVTRPLAPIQAL